ncbi:MAG: hypothetical protein HY537_16015 [Deltaproteobacteria bacterium]|nr:hypothetical protein [Deltaproteobacteria bacterium]
MRVVVFLLLMLANSALGVWPPRDGKKPFGDTCRELFFWMGVEARFASENMEQRVKDLEAQGNKYDEAELARLRLELAQLRGISVRHPMAPDIDKFFGAVDSGMPPELAYLTLGENPMRPEYHMAVSPTGDARFNNQNYKVIVPEFDMDLQTTFFRHPDGWIPKGSRVVVPALAGIGAEHSHSGSVFSLMNFLMSPKNSGTIGHIKSDPNYVPAAAFAFDLPNNGTAFRSLEFTDLKTNLLWLRAALTWPLAHWPKENGPAPVCIPIARSASPALLMELHQSNPTLFGGMILTSPMHPDDLAVSNVTLAKLVREGVYKSNDEANRWSDKLYEQMTWHKQQDPFKNDVPVLIMVGTEDPEETEATAPKVGWNIYREWERKYPNKVRFIIIKGASHDLFATRDKQVLTRTMKYVYRFFQFVLNKEKNMAEAFPVEPDEIRLESAGVN